MIRALLMARSKHGKTTHAQLLASRYVELSGKKVRVVNADGGSVGLYERTEMYKGKKLFVCYPNKYEHKIAVMKELANGYWPINGKKSRAMDESKDGMIIVDGMSAASRMMLRHLANHDELIGKKHALAPAGVFYDGDERIGVNAMSHYNVVHAGLEQIVGQMSSLPFHSLWTSLLTESETEEAQTVYGPKTVGRAITNEVTSWFPDTWHQERYVLKSGKVGYRCWFDRHDDKKMGAEFLSSVSMGFDVKNRLLEETQGKSWLPVNEKIGMHWFYFDFLGER